MPKYVVDYIIHAVEFVAKNSKKFKPYYIYDTKKNNWFYSDINSPKSREATLEALVKSTIGESNQIYPTESDFNKVIRLNNDILNTL